MSIPTPNTNSDSIVAYLGICVTTDGYVYTSSVTTKESDDPATEAAGQAQECADGEVIAYTLIHRVTLPAPTCPQIETIVSRTDTINRVTIEATHKPA